MVAYSFRARFVDPIDSGRKPHTIRADRKRHARPGEEVQLYTGMRTKHCRLIGRATCDRVEPIKLRIKTASHQAMVKIGKGRPITEPAALDLFAQSDGFANWRELENFWIEEHATIREFTGVIIYWKDYRSARHANG